MTENQTSPKAAEAMENLRPLRTRDLEELIERAAERGAERVLEKLGLQNGQDQGLTSQDVGELRALLDAWRAARRTAWQTAIKVLTTCLLAALVAGAAFKLKLFGGGQ